MQKQSTVYRPTEQDPDPHPHACLGGRCVHDLHGARRSDRGRDRAHRGRAVPALHIERHTQHGPYLETYAEKGTHDEDPQGRTRLIRTTTPFTEGWPANRPGVLTLESVVGMPYRRAILPAPTDRRDEGKAA